VVGLAGLAVDAVGLRRQLRLAPFVDLDDRAALRQVVRHPLVLRAEIGLDIGRVAAVLVGRGEQVLLPDDAVGLREVFAEAGIARIHARPGQGLRDALRQRDADRVLGPAERDEPFDCTPLIDGVERLVCEGLRERAHGAAILSAVNDKNRDLL
jgi:hypothetical protein